MLSPAVPHQPLTSQDLCPVPFCERWMGAAAPAHGNMPSSGRGVTFGARQWCRNSAKWHRTSLCKGRVKQACKGRERAQERQCQSQAAFISKLFPGARYKTKCFSSETPLQETCIIRCHKCGELKLRRGEESIQQHVCSSFDGDHEKRTADAVLIGS